MKLTLEQLSEQSDTSIRTIRYYMQEGLIPAAHGQKRGAWYSSEHLTNLIRIKQWRESGLSLDAIRDLLVANDEQRIHYAKPGSIEVRSHLIVADGVELVISPDRINLSQAQIRKIYQAVSNTLNDIQQEAEKND